MNEASLKIKIETEIREQWVLNSNCGYVGKKVLYPAKLWPEMETDVLVVVEDHVIII